MLCTIFTSILSLNVKLFGIVPRVTELAQLSLLEEGLTKMHVMSQVMF